MSGHIQIIQNLKNNNNNSGMSLNKSGMSLNKSGHAEQNMGIGRSLDGLTLYD